MPLPRYQIRNEYSLADPELFKAAEIDDPEALLEGVAMAGLVGVLRQLGDLSEFAAEVFHGLHDHVMATAARGHDLMARVQQLEAEIPSIEKAFLSQTSHTSFHSNAGVDWHPYLRLEQNLITHGELPRCVMDSYEECRGPPRLFLLDKFDVAGAGACLTRYTDPSFFKVESAHSALSVEVQREKKYRKVKKTGLRWKNGTPEFVPPSHAKLRQLFLEESVEKGCSDPARLVKLKRKQLNASPFDSRSGKSYMAKFLETLPEEVCVISVNPLPLKLTSDSATESGQEIHDVTTVSPVKRSLQDTDSTCSSPNAHEVVLKPSMDELYGKVIGRPIVKMPEPKAECERDEIPSFHQKQMVEEEIVGDGKGKPEGSVDGDNSEDMTREVDKYMDALTPMDLEMESDHDYQPKSNWGLLNVEKHEMDPEQLELEAHFSDAQSIMNFSLSDGGDSLLKKVRSSFSYSDTLSNLAEITQSDGEGSGKVFPTSEAFGPQNTEMLSDQLPGDVAALREKSNDLLLPNNMCIDEDNIHCHGDASSNYTSAGSLHPLPLLQPATSSMQDQSDETPSESTIPSSTVAYREEKYTRVDSPEVGSDLTSQNRNGTSFTAPAESHSVNKLDGEDTHLSSHDLLHLSNNSELASENKGGDDSSDEELPMDFAEKSYQDNKVNGTIGVTWSNTSPIEGRACFPDFSETEDSVVEKDDALVSEVVHDALSETGVLRETSTFIADTSQNCNFQEQRVSGMENVPQAELESVEETTVCSAEANVADIYETADSEKIGASCCKVAAVDGEAAPLELPSNCEEGLLLEDPVEINDAVVESIRAENLAFLETAADYVHAKASPDEDVDFVCPAQDLIHSPVALNSGIEDPHKEGLIFNELASPEYLAGPEAENEKTQLEVAPKDFDFSSCNLTSCYESNSDIIYGVHNSLADEIINSLPAVGEINGVHNSLASEIILSLPAGRLIRSSGLNDQELELKSLHQTHHLDGGEDAMSLPGVHPVPETSAAQPLVLLADQLEGSDQIQSSNHTNKKRLSDDVSEFCQEGLARECSLSGYLQQSTGEEINYTEPEMGPLNSVLPSFGLIPEADQMNLEEMPPLPPLPPMQWRLGKTQHALLFLQGDSRDHNPESVPLTLPFRDHEKVQSAFPAHQSDFLQPAIPFLSVIAVDDKSEHASELVDNANSQTNSHDSEGTESTNPFLTLSASPGEKPEHGFLAPEHEIVQSSSNPFLSLSADDDTASKYYSVSSPKKLIHALSQSAPEPELRHTLENLEGETGSPSDTAVLPRFEDTASNPVSSPEKLIHILGPSASEPGLHNTSESSGLEHANPSDTYVLSPVKAERAASKCDSVSLLEKSITLNRSAPEPVHGNPSYTSALSPRKAEKQPPDGLPNSEGESLLHSDPFALSATSEFGQETRGSTAKLPRPRSPLIDALAAHDKSKLRKMSERVRPQSEQKFDKRNSLLEQIRTRSFNLKPAVVSSPSIQGHKTNLRVAAILEKANAIRQATAGSDEDDEDWSDS